MVDAPSLAATGTLPQLLIVEDNLGLQEQMRWALADDYAIHLASDRPAALDVVATHRPTLVVLDLGLPPDPNGASEGLSTLESIIAAYPKTKVIIASGNEERANALKAIAYGAHDFLAKPVDVDELRLTLNRAWRLAQLEEENRKLAQGSHRPFSGLIASSKVMLDLCQKVEQIASTDITIMLIGESGTGKEVIARAAHDLSGRSGPFIALNCAAIPDTLLESELFGYERGAFTGAVKQSAGKVDQAAGGTLFLDEIGDMPLGLQSKMLRFLQDHKFQRLGGRTDISVDVRIISASNRDIREMVKLGTFREDLYFRINEVYLAIPPLRDRDDDAVMIANALLRRYAETYKKGALNLGPAALRTISNYSWPGNVRELENRIKRAVIFAPDPNITPADMELADIEPPLAQNEEIATLKELRRRTEISAIKRALASCDNNVTQAAKVLGISRPSLYNLLTEHGIKVLSDPRPASR